MIYSLSEIDANCKKAARGAGLTWGYAEEAGKAAKWLAAHQLPGAELLASYLALRATDTEYYDADTPLCPLLTGAMLSDLGYDEATPSRSVNVVYPLLLVPYLDRLSRGVGIGLSVQWLGTAIQFSEDSVFVLDRESLSTDQNVEVSYQWHANDSSGLKTEHQQTSFSTGQDIAPQHWQTLETLAHHTYVPATEASRRGAGPSD